MRVKISVWFLLYSFFEVGIRLSLKMVASRLTFSLLSKENEKKTNLGRGAEDDDHHARQHPQEDESEEGLVEPASKAVVVLLDHPWDVVEDLDAEGPAEACAVGQIVHINPSYTCFSLTTPPDNKGVPPQAAGGDPKVGRPAEPNRTHTLPTDPSSSKATCDTRGLDPEQLQELDRAFGSGHLLHRDLLQHPRRWSNRTITATGSKSQPLLAFVLKEVLSSVVVIFYTHKKRLRQVVMTTSRSCSKAKPH
ncbi:hypothetical protein BHM03_00028262 [Ensete ventricosum]|nr:hypothetical protein BHM03_00028262 [Ensete ventricosum]